MREDWTKPPFSMQIFRNVCYRHYYVQVVNHSLKDNMLKTPKDSMNSILQGVGGPILEHLLLMVLDMI